MSRSLWALVAFLPLVAHLAGGLVALGTYAAIRRGDEMIHRAWMIRSFALTFAAVTLRIILPLELAFGISFHAAYQIVSWACWIPNLLVAEWLNARPSRTPAVLAAAH